MIWLSRCFGILFFLNIFLILCRYTVSFNDHIIISNFWICDMIVWKISKKHDKIDHLDSLQFYIFLPHPQRMIRMIRSSRLLVPHVLAPASGAGPTFSSSLRIPIIKPEKKCSWDLGAKSVQETVTSHKVILLMEEIPHHVDWKFIPLFTAFYTSKRWVVWDFWTINSMKLQGKFDPKRLVSKDVIRNGRIVWKETPCFKHFLNQERSTHVYTVIMQQQTGCRNSVSRHGIAPFPEVGHILFLTFCSATYQVL